MPSKSSHPESKPWRDFKVIHRDVAETRAHSHDFHPAKQMCSASSFKAKNP